MNREIQVSKDFAHFNFLEAMCFVGVPQRSSKVCQSVRGKELAKNRIFYKMSGPQNIYPFPHLDQPKKTALGYLSKDSFHSKWFYLYFKVLGNARGMAFNATKMKYAKSVLSSYDDYNKLVKDFRDSVMVNRDVQYCLT